MKYRKTPVLLNNITWFPFKPCSTSDHLQRLHYAAPSAEAKKKFQKWQKDAFYKFSHDSTNPTVKIGKLEYWATGKPASKTSPHSPDQGIAEQSQYTDYQTEFLNAITYNSSLRYCISAYFKKLHFHNILLSTYVEIAGDIKDRLLSGHLKVICTITCYMNFSSLSLWFPDKITAITFQP